MADFQPPEGLVNGGGGGPIAVTSSEMIGSKRQRRPSVRLGEIGGDQLYDAHPRRTVSSSKQWKQNQKFVGENKREGNKGSKTRTLTNLSSNSGGGEFVEALDDDKEVNLDTAAIGSWRVSSKDSKKRASNTTKKRVRSNWISKIDGGGGGGGGGSNGHDVDGDEKYSGGDDVDIDDGYGEFDMENSGSPLKEQSPLHSLENLGDGNVRGGYYTKNRRAIRARDRDNHHSDGVELSGPSATDVRDYRNNGRCGVGVDGVRIWLGTMGLERYAPIFEIHEVDDEVLPMLTLEDLKDMGINAVGSRRKMFCSIQKLRKGFS